MIRTTKLCEISVILSLFIISITLAQDATRPIEREQALVAVSLAASRVKLESVKNKLKSDRKKAYEEDAIRFNLLARDLRMQEQLNAAQALTANNDSIVIVPGIETATDAYSEILEDMMVMSRILENLMGKINRVHVKQVKYSSRSLWNPESQSPGNNKIGGMFLQNYGVLFSMNVNMPLTVDLPEKVEEETENKIAVSLWEQTRQEIYNRDGILMKRNKQIQETSEADLLMQIEVIKKLKDDLLNLLKHTQNIRHLSDENWVVFRVQGIDAILTLRVKKAVIDDFAIDTINAEQFRTQVEELIFKTDVGVANTPHPESIQ